MNTQAIMDAHLNLIGQINDLGYNKVIAFIRSAFEKDMLDEEKAETLLGLAKFEYLLEVGRNSHLTAKELADKADSKFTLSGVVFDMEQEKEDLFKAWSIRSRNDSSFDNTVNMLGSE